MAMMVALVMRGAYILIPKPIYDALPGIYLVAGSTSALSLEAEIGKLSGILLIMAGAIVLYWRRGSRSGEPAGRRMG